MKSLFVMLILALVSAGCATRSTARLRAQNAFLAGQNAALRQAAAANFHGITVVGAVQNREVPWVAGLTLVQAVATANYVGATEPKQIIITHDGESATLDVKVLFNGTDIPLEAGDVVELR
jgi:hypothetical protein